MHSKIASVPTCDDTPTQSRAHPQKNRLTPGAGLKVEEGLKVEAERRRWRRTTMLMNPPKQKKMHAHNRRFRVALEDTTVRLAVRERFGTGIKVWESKPLMWTKEAGKFGF
jgi:hypothetical protein